MAGYNWNEGKSNNAVYAENNGLKTATQLSKELGVSPSAIKAMLEPTEWHHTSTYFNKTDYYRFPPLVITPFKLNITKEERSMQLEEARKKIEEKRETLLKKMKDFDARKVEIITHENCTAEWLEWSGSRSKPICTKRHEENCKVVDNGKSTLYITPLHGKQITKRKGTKGLIIYLNGKKLY